MSDSAEADLIVTGEVIGWPARRLVESVSAEADVIETGEVCG